MAIPTATQCRRGLECDVDEVRPVTCFHTTPSDVKWGGMIPRARSSFHGKLALATRMGFSILYHSNFEHRSVGPPSVTSERARISSIVTSSSCLETSILSEFFKLSAPIQCFTVCKHCLSFGPMQALLQLVGRGSSILPLLMFPPTAAVTFSPGV